MAAPQFDEFYPFIDFESHHVDPSRQDKAMMEQIQRVPLFCPYHPEVFKTVSDMFENNLSGAVKHYSARNVEFPDEQMVLDRLLPDRKNPMGRFRTCSLIKEETLGKVSAHLPIATMKRTYSHAVLSQYGYIDVDIKCCRPSLFNNFIQRSSWYDEDDRKNMKDFFKKRDVIFKNVAEEMSAPKRTEDDPRAAVSEEDVKDLFTACCNGADLQGRIDSLRDGRKQKSVWNDSIKCFEHVAVDDQKRRVRDYDDFARAENFLHFKVVIDLMEKVNTNLIKANMDRIGHFIDVDAKTQKRQREWEDQDRPAASLRAWLTKKIEAAMVNAIGFGMEAHVIGRVLFASEDVLSRYNNFTPVYSFDGAAVQLNDDVETEDFMNVVNEVAEPYGVTFKHKPWNPVLAGLEIEQFADLPTTQEEAVELLMDLFQRFKDKISKKRLREIEGGNSLSKKRKEDRDPTQCAECFDDVDAKFAMECIYLENQQKYVVKLQPDQYGRRLWSAPFSSERKLMSHFKEWVYDENVPRSFIQAKLEPSNTSPFRKLKDVIWFPCKNTPVVGNDLNIFNGFIFDGYVSGPEDPNWNDDAIEVLKKQLRETFELEEGESVNEEGFSPNALIFLDSWTALATHPEQKLGFMIFLHGTEGSGKTKLLEFLVNCFGREYLTTAKSDMGDITGRFNGQVDRKLILNIPEPAAGIKEETLRAIMNLVTDQSVSTEHKGVQKGNDAINYVHLYACINNLNSAFDNGDILQRRWRVIRMNQALKDDRAHCDKVNNYHAADKVFENRYALASLFWWLQNRTMTVNFNTIPDAPRMVKAAEARETPAVLFFQWLKRKLITGKVKGLVYKVDGDTASGRREVCYTPEHLWKMYEAWYKANYESNPTMLAKVGTAAAFNSQFTKVASVYTAQDNGVADPHPEILKFIRREQVDLRSVGGGRKTAYIFDIIELLNEVLAGRQLVIKCHHRESVRGFNDTYIKTMEAVNGQEVAKYSKLDAFIEEADTMAQDQFKKSVTDLYLADGVPHSMYVARTVTLPAEALSHLQ